MSVVFDRIGPNGRRYLRAAVLLFFTAAIVSSPAAAQSAGGRITVTLDQAQVMKLPEGVATVVIGNPLIADISVQPGGMAVITGKGYGITNLLVLDRAGKVLDQKTLQVQGPRDNVVVVYRGVERESYSCAPKCERRITLGDSPAYFAATIGQTGARTGQAQGGAQPPK